MSTVIKICGLKTPETLGAALDAGADWVGFVFFPKSPRNISLVEAKALGASVAGRAKKVALTVDASDDDIASIIDALHPDMVQLHGHETPERVAAIRATFRLPVMKAIGIASAEDISELQRYAPVADWLLLDAKPPKDAAHPGGNGVRFDWNLLAGLDLAKPFMVSGGLDPLNVSEALHLSHAAGVDVSSGVESAPGVKDEQKIRDFIVSARRASAALSEKDRGQ